MFFTIDYNEPIKKEIAIYRFKRWSKVQVASYRMGATETLLNDYLKHTYGTTFKTACFQILIQCKCMMNGEQEMVVIIPEGRLAKLARIITYGTGKIPGSQVLLKAFMQA